MKTPNELTLQAIAILTANFDDPNGKRGFAASVAVDTAYDDDPEQGYKDLTIGLINLCTYLLVDIEKRTGTSAPTVLQEAARFHQD